MGQSAALDRSNVPPNVSALYLQIREAHTRDGWHIGGPLVAERHHLTLQERQSASQSRPCALRWMTPFCDSMANVFSGVCMEACVCGCAFVCGERASERASERESGERAACEIGPDPIKPQTLTGRGQRPSSSLRSRRCARLGSLFTVRALRRRRT